jgi:hypothetical protein
MDDGSWPSAFKRIGADFLPKKKAPPNDSIVAPQFHPPEWLADVAAFDGALEIVRRSNDKASEAAQIAEAKAARLVQICLALITISIALSGFQVKAAVGGTWPDFVLWLLVVPSIVALTLLALAALEAAQVDRVGFSRTAQLSDISDGGGPAALLGAIAAEEEGRQLARWTAKHKLTDLMQARAWFSRGLLALLAAAWVSVVTFGSGQPPTPDESGSANLTTTTIQSSTSTVTSTTQPQGATSTSAP